MLLLSLCYHTHCCSPFSLKRLSLSSSLIVHSRCPSTFNNKLTLLFLSISHCSPSQYHTALSVLPYLNSHSHTDSRSHSRTAFSTGGHSRGRKSIKKLVGLLSGHLVMLTTHSPPVSGHRSLITYHCSLVTDGGHFVEARRSLNRSLGGAPKWSLMRVNKRFLMGVNNRSFMRLNKRSMMELLPVQGSPIIFT